MNSEWEFLRELWFYCLAGLVAVVPVAVLIAAVMKSSYPKAMSFIKDFLTNWASFGDEAVWNFAIQGVSKVGGTIILLAILTWGLSRLGDKTLPYVSSAFKYFDNERVAWSITYQGEWEELRYQYREITGIKNNLINWEKAKARLGSHSYRFFRVLFWLALLVAGAGVINLVRGITFPRGTLELILGLMMAIAAAALWTDRNDRFIRNLVAEYRDVYKERNGGEPLLPVHYPKTKGQVGQRIPKGRIRTLASYPGESENVFVEENSIVIKFS